MLAGVKMLCCDEPLGMDPERLAALYVEMGETAANAAVSRALRDLSDAMEQLRCDMSFRAPAEVLCQSSHKIRDIAEPLGLTTLAVSAANVADAVISGDTVATFATLARLEKVANRSLKVVWDIHDLSD
ncbi:hypothetical protein [Actibacterium mucosum]|nr:hypothetical protein [Actibacterium mucosum]